MRAPPHPERCSSKPTPWTTRQEQDAAVAPSTKLQSEKSQVELGTYHFLDFEASDFGVSDFEASGFGVSDFGVSGFEASGFGVSVFGDS